MSVAERSGILRVVTRLNVGGPARHALLLTRGLRDVYPTVLAAGTPTASEGELIDPEVPIHRVPLVRPPHPRADMQSLVAVRRLLCMHRPALLHTHMAKAGSVGRVAASTLGQRPRTVHTFHGHVLEGYFRPSVQRAIVEAERRLARRTDVLIAVSVEVRDELLALGVGRPSQFEVVPLGLDLSTFLAVQEPSGRLRATLNLPPSAPLVGVSGRLVPIKDHVTLLDAMRLLPGVHLAVIGDGELRPSLELAARTRDLEGRVHFCGWWDDMAAALSDLDVVVLTSRNEGTPVALIEASAAARPVVATDVGGVCSVVEDGTTGFLAPPGDSEAIAARIGRLLAAPALAQAMGERGRAHVATRFGAERLLADMRSLYDDVLSGRRRAVAADLGGVAEQGRREQLVTEGRDGNQR